MTSLAGRLMLTGVFVLSSLMFNIPHFSSVVDKMGSLGIPMPRVLLVGAIALCLLGSAMIVVGFRPRIGALLLLVFLTAVTLTVHNFRKAPPEMKAMELTQFLKNMSMMGAMLLIMLNGVGPWTLDELLARNRDRSVTGGGGDQPPGR